MQFSIPLFYIENIFGIFRYCINKHRNIRKIKLKLGSFFFYHFFLFLLLYSIKLTPKMHNNVLFLKSVLFLIPQQPRNFQLDTPKSKCFLKMCIKEAKLNRFNIFKVMIANFSKAVKFLRKIIFFRSFFVVICSKVLLLDFEIFGPCAKNSFFFFAAKTNSHMIREKKVLFAFRLMLPHHLHEF